MAKDVIYVSEAEAANDFASLLSVFPESNSERLTADELPSALAALK